MTMGDRILLMRKSKGYTMQELADLVGVNHPAVNKWEKGIVTNIPLDKVERLAQIFGCSPAWLVGWEDMDKSSKVDELSVLIDSLPQDKKQLVLTLVQSIAERK